MTAYGQFHMALIGEAAPWLDASGRYRVREKLRSTSTGGLAVVAAAASEYVQERKTALVKFSPIHAYWRRLDGKTSTADCKDRARPDVRKSIG